MGYLENTPRPAEAKVAGQSGLNLDSQHAIWQRVLPTLTVPNLPTTVHAMMNTNTIHLQEITPIEQITNGFNFLAIRPRHHLPLEA